MQRYRTYVISKNTALRFISIVLISVMCITYFSISNLSTGILKYMINGVIPSANVNTYNGNVINDLSDSLLGFDILNKKTWLNVFLPAIATAKIPEKIEIIVEDVPVEEKRLPIVESKVISENRIKNETSYTPDFEYLLNQPLGFSKENKPSILIVHTHASESYTPTNENSYLPSDPSRTEDTRFNMIRVGEEMKKELASYGLNVIHDKTIHDYPSYTNSYKNTLVTIEKHLIENPSIQIVLDMHRDALQAEDGTKTKLVANVEGEKVAQVLVLCGTNQAGLPNDHWEENLKFALKIQNELDNLYPGFARPLNLRKERFNMHATTGSLILEIGTNGNTLEEALASIKYLAKCIANVLN